MYDDGSPSATCKAIHITIDTHFRGMTTLKSFADGPEHQLDCIAIPGLGGHAFGSFKKRGDTHMWLRDSLPIDLSGIRIMIYGFDTRLHGSHSFQDLESLASALRNSLNLIQSSRVRSTEKFKRETVADLF